MRLQFFLLAILFLVHSSQPGVVYRKPDANSNAGDAGDPLPGTRGLAQSFLGRKVKIWPNGKIIYRLHPNVGQSLKDVVRTAMQTIQNATSNVVKFQLDTANRTKGVIVVYDYFYPKSKSITYAGFCYSKVGYHDNETQPLVLSFGEGSRCCDPGPNAVGFAIHELMHALGFVHEFQRNDRDKYIIVSRRKVKEVFGIEGDLYDANFGPQDDDTKNLPFDFRSILQYDLKNVIEDKPGRTGKVTGVKEDTGHFCGLSAGDRNLVERTYYKESRGAKATLIVYKDLYKIPGVSCKSAIKVTPDEMV